MRKRIKQIKIKNLILKNNTSLAPMAGVTDIAFRHICREYGAGLVTTEMISSRGIYYKDKNTRHLMQIEKDEHPVAFQIFGNDPDIMLYAAQFCEENGADIVDINMGCPTPKIVNNGDGSALMRNLLLAAKIVETVARKINIPVSVKFRKGWDDENINAVEFAKAMEESGADFLCIHGRTREQFYSGKSDLEIIKKVKESVNIPLFGNGDIFCADDAMRMIDFCGCDGVAVARGSYGNPFIFCEILSAFENKPYKKPSEFEYIEKAKEHLKYIIQYYGERIGIKESRKHMGWYIKGIKNSAFYRNEINKKNSYSEVIEILNNIQNNL